MKTRAKFSQRGFKNANLTVDASVGAYLADLSEGVYRVRITLSADTDTPGKWQYLELDMKPDEARTLGESLIQSADNALRFEGEAKSKRPQ